MRNRLSSHLLLLFALLALEAVGYFAIHRAALIRGYDASWIGALRDLAMYFPIIVVAFWISAVKKFKGNWVLFTTAILLFSVGLLIQYRLYSDPEYNARNKAAARQEKTDALRLRYINETYDTAKRQMMGLSPAPPTGTEAEVPVKESSYTIWNALTASYTWIPLAGAIISSSAGKAAGNTTPWEPSKIPFLICFAGTLTARYKDVARTY